MSYVDEPGPVAAGAKDIAQFQLVEAKAPAISMSDTKSAR